jgi:hypothetical protein
LRHEPTRFAPCFGGKTQAAVLGSGLAVVQALAARNHIGLIRGFYVITLSGRGRIDIEQGKAVIIGHNLFYNSCRLYFAANFNIQKQVNNHFPNSAHLSGSDFLHRLSTGGLLPQPNTAAYLG